MRLQAILSCLEQSLRLVPAWKSERVRVPGVGVIDGQVLGIESSSIPGMNPADVRKNAFPGR